MAAEFFDTSAVVKRYDTRESGSGLRVQALIDTDRSGKILSEELAWVPASRDFWWR